MIEESELDSSRHQIKYIAEQPIEVKADRDKIGSVLSNCLARPLNMLPKKLELALTLLRINDKHTATQPGKTVRSLLQGKEPIGAKYSGLWYLAFICDLYFTSRYR
ncbi:hypothetical protein [Mucilaginibacter paludis]|uniref:Uncharacterized protein n=1 Tax=Mucilaginibacter paludis DSM 18603 TaxID=714943 RepID=H1Y0T8_9SPHI|nr:hypothetical protein [Mucilaginibacter paludis]EHQ28828.1 hypothetical protein Mucpa_4743 [Mucilaginibacter paludis DSM 18603]